MPSDTSEGGTGGGSRTEGESQAGVPSPAKGGLALSTGGSDV